MPMREYSNLKDITIPPEQEAIMNIVCEAWAECRELECQNCPDRPKKIMSLMECFSLKFSRKLMEAGFVTVVRCKDCKHVQRQVLKNSGGFEGWICEYDQEHFTAGDHFCSSGERRE